MSKIGSMETLLNNNIKIIYIKFHHHTILQLVHYRLPLLSIFLKHVLTVQRECLT